MGSWAGRGGGRERLQWCFDTKLSAFLLRFAIAPNLFPHTGVPRTTRDSRGRHSGQWRLVGVGEERIAKICNEQIQIEVEVHISFPVIKAAKNDFFEVHLVKEPLSASLSSVRNCVSVCAVRCVSLHDEKQLNFPSILSWNEWQWVIARAAFTYAEGFVMW